MQYIVLVLIGLIVGEVSPAFPEDRFHVSPAEGEIIAIACIDEDNDNCFIEYHDLDWSGLEVLRKKKKWPGIPSDIPGNVKDGLESAADALGDISYVHVAVTYKGTTYEYKFDRTTGWNAFRATPATMACKLECKVKPVEKGPS